MIGSTDFGGEAGVALEPDILNFRIDLHTIARKMICTYITAAQTSCQALLRTLVCHMGSSSNLHDVPKISMAAAPLQCVTVPLAAATAYGG